jgi:hypothetical protein
VCCVNDDVLSHSIDQSMDEWMDGWIVELLILEC